MSVFHAHSCRGRVRPIADTGPRLRRAGRATALRANLRTWRLIRTSKSRRCDARKRNDHMTWRAGACLNCSQLPQLRSPTRCPCMTFQAPRIGNLTFELSCTPAAQALLVQGVEWLHSFEYQRAEQRFFAASTADPGCGIAQWGVAMSYYTSLWAAPTPGELQKGTAAIEKARLVGAGSEREKDYIRALGVFYRGAPAIDHKTRVLAYNDAMAALHLKYPADHQATLFYALSLVAVGTIVHDPSFAREKQAGALIDQVLAAEPDNPGAWHYIIHSFDYPALAELALPAARRYALVASRFRACAAHAFAHLHTAWPVGRID